MFWKNDINLNNGSHPIKILYGSISDTNRSNREIPYKVYYPENLQKPVPLIFWSHGLGGNYHGASFLSRYIASYGYVLIHPTHKGTDTALWEGKEGHPWDNIRATVITEEMALNRFADIPFLLEKLPEIISEHEALSGIIDSKSVGMSGHSFGAYTTQILSGQSICGTPADTDLYRYTSHMIKEFVPKSRAGIAYSMMTCDKDDKDEYYKNISYPMFYFTGTNDESPITGEPYENRIPVYDRAEAEGQHLLIIDEADHMVFAGNRGKLGGYDKIELHESIIKLASLCYWDAYLKNDENAFEWLVGDGFENFLGMEGTYKNKNL